MKNDFDSQKFYHDLLQLIDQCTHLNSMIVTSKEPEAIIVGTRDVLLQFFFVFGHAVPHLIKFQPKNYITTPKTTEIQGEDINANSSSVEEDETTLSGEDIFLIFLICILILVLLGYLGYYKGKSYEIQIIS